MDQIYRRPKGSSEIGNWERAENCSARLMRSERFTRRGGNYNNTSNSGLGYVNGNNERGNTNTNYGGRPRSHIHSVTK